METYWSEPPAPPAGSILLVGRRLGAGRGGLGKVLKPKFPVPAPLLPTDWLSDSLEDTVSLDTERDVGGSCWCGRGGAGRVSGGGGGGGSMLEVKDVVIKVMDILMEAPERRLEDGEGDGFVLVLWW